MGPMVESIIIGIATLVLGSYFVWLGTTILRIDRRGERHEGKVERLEADHKELRDRFSEFKHDTNGELQKLTNKVTLLEIKRAS